MNYFTGKPCRHGHISERNTKARTCLACSRASGRRNHQKSKNDPSYIARRKRVKLAHEIRYPERKKARLKRWLALFPEKAKATKRAWYEANPEKISEHRRVWREANREKARQAVRDWAERNPAHASDVMRSSNSNYRARKATNGGNFTADDVAALRHIQKSRCAICQKGISQGFHVDHIMPIAKGGTSDRRNLQLTCGFCNRSKGAKHPIDFARSLGLLL